MTKTKMLLIQLTIIVGALSVATGGRAQLSTGDIQGSVVDPGGKAIVGATVYCTRLAQYIASQLAPGETVMNSSVTTGAGGTFDLGGLPPGDYRICVEASGVPYLDPCKWGTSILAKGLSAGEIRSIPSIVMSLGAILNVRINDPLGLLKPVASTVSDGGIIVGVQLATGAFYAASLTGADSGGREMQIPIAVGMPLSLWVFSGTLTLTDAGGKGISKAGAGIPLQIAIGTAVANTTINVTGLLPANAVN